MPPRLPLFVSLLVGLAACSPVPTGTKDDGINDPYDGASDRDADADTDADGDTDTDTDADGDTDTDTDTDTDADADADTDIAIAGNWRSDLYMHSISNTTWVEIAPPPPAETTYNWEVVSYSNSGQYAIAHNASDNYWGPGLWSRFDWEWDGGGNLWTCLTVYNAETEAEAEDTPAADFSGDGCGIFGWNELSPL